MARPRTQCCLPPSTALTTFAHYCEPNPADPMGLRSIQQYRDNSTLATTPPSTTQSRRSTIHRKVAPDGRCMGNLSCSVVDQFLLFTPYFFSTTTFMIQDVTTVTMSQVRGMAISRLGRLGHSKSSIQWLNAAARGMRRYSAAAASNGPLPLEGYRVLDMSRVLAGVS